MQAIVEGPTQTPCGSQLCLPTAGACAVGPEFKSNAELELDFWHLLALKNVCTNCLAPAWRTPYALIMVHKQGILGDRDVPAPGRSKVRRRHLPLEDCDWRRVSAAATTSSCRLSLGQVIRKWAVRAAGRGEGGRSAGQFCIRISDACWN